MYVDAHIIFTNLGVNHKTGTPTKPVNELHVAVLPEFSPLSCVSDALQKLPCILDRYCWSLNRLLPSVDHNDRRLPHLQLQPVRSIGVNNMK